MVSRVLLAAAAAWLFVSTASAQVGAPFCLGNGCPCANDDAGGGCGNFGLDGDPSTGAMLSATGTVDVFADDLVLTAAGINPGQFGVFFMGDIGAPTTLADGLRCVTAGANGVWRFHPAGTNNSGNLVLRNPVAFSQGFPGAGVIVAGSTWNFQAWYRDPMGPCDTGSNFSNGLPVTFQAPGVTEPIRTELAGRKRNEYPQFDFVRSHLEGKKVFATIDTSRLPGLIGASGDLYVVAAKTEAEWEANATLADVRGVPTPWTIVAGDVKTNTVEVDDGTLLGTTETQVGIGYDLVFDVDEDGLLGPGDVIDGLSDEAGFYVVRDTTLPGPYSVTEVLYDGGTWLEEDIYYPDNIASLGQVPLIVVSHGNGHNYQWYDHIGFHMASYGYVVMSHSNNTQPGIETAAETTLENTEHFLANLDTIAGGVLDGHIDSSRITWIGHSRGGEGVVRAYDRLVDEDFVPTTYSADDIQLVSSIAPTTFLKKAQTNPHKVNYHLWIGSADADVAGAPNSGQEPFSILERAQGTKAAIVLQGMGHAVFHDGGGGWVADGPCLNGRAKTHTIMRGYLLPLVEYFIQEDPASKEFLWRQWEKFSPQGAPPDPPGCIVVNLEFSEPKKKFVVDDFQTEVETNRSSSGRAVTFSVTDFLEDRFHDDDGVLAWNANDPMNGMTRADVQADDARGIVFSWDAPAFLEFELDPAERNLNDDGYLSFRACQQTRHPNTVAELGDVLFDVTLVDANGTSSTISIGVNGGGIEEPYQRGGLGGGAGWANEFETIRMRVSDFVANGSGLNLALIRAIRFEFGGPNGSALGRVGFDDLEILRGL